MARQTQVLTAEEYNAMLSRITLADWLRAIARLADGEEHEYHADYWVVRFGEHQFPHRAVLQFASGGKFNETNMDGSVGKELEKRLRDLHIPILNLRKRSKKK